MHCTRKAKSTETEIFTCVFIEKTALNRKASDNFIAFLFCSTLFALVGTIYTLSKDNC